MNETSLSLLQQLRQCSDQDSWHRLHRLYAPLIRKWLIRYDIQPCDADDLAQEVLLAVSQDVESFEHNGRSGAFRAWVKGILVNRLRKFWRRRDRAPNASGGSDMNRRLAELDDPAGQMTIIWNNDHDQHVLREMLRAVRPRFTEATWSAFWRTTFDGETPKAVAEELHLSQNAVIIAKSRVLSRLRQEANGLVDTSSRFLPNV